MKSESPLLKPLSRFYRTSCRQLFHRLQNTFSQQLRAFETSSMWWGGVCVCVCGIWYIHCQAILALNSNRKVYDQQLSEKSHSTHQSYSICTAHWTLTTHEQRVCVCVCVEISKDPMDQRHHTLRRQKNITSDEQHQ